jgi:radical SAM superfamily enzyme YgiQ (UPF0313 family)
MTDILLTHSYFAESDLAQGKVIRPYPPLVPLYVSSYLKSRDFAVELLDTTFRTKPDVLTALRVSRASIISVHANLMARPNSVALIRAAKASGAVVTVSGQEPGTHAGDYLANGADIVINGESELTLAEMIPHVAQYGLSRLDKIDGISYRDGDGQMRKTASRALIADLDAQPFPDREAVDMKRYLDSWQQIHGKRSVSLIAARGCPYDCSWCSHGLYGRSHRRRSAENVVAEILHLREAYGPDHLFFADDVFTINGKWLEQYAAEMKRHGLRYPFETISREDRLDERTVDLLAELDCHRLWVGAESGSQRILDAMKRRTDAARMREMIALLKSRGIRTGTFVMVGYEGESWSDIDETARHLRAAQADEVLTTIVHPIKGTAYYDLVADRIIGGGPWAESNDRDLTVKGRHSRRFYRYTQHWLSAQSRLGRGGWARRAKTRIKSGLSRLAMYATRFEVENG